MSASSLDSSYRYCRKITQKVAGNFSYSFWTLPYHQRRAMEAVYTYFFETDEIGDNQVHTLIQKKENLQRWKKSLENAINGTFTSQMHPALKDSIDRFHIPPQYFFEVIQGVEQDLEKDRYKTFQELKQYCHLVASSVGAVCIHIWGFQGTDASQFAEDCGVALQLTNILRDIQEDFNRDRIYLPQEDLDRFNYSTEDLQSKTINPAFRQLIQFQVDRTKEFYQSGALLTSCLNTKSLPVFQAMIRIYYQLLLSIEKHPEQIFQSRVRLSPLKKWQIAIDSLWGKYTGRKIWLGELQREV
ncbi:Farnesyl-diphosphate farnesyltransferase [Planctomycetales bacterium 10988]|nr:Farnesyl-diphosphate farnesyltransferase [Planctomycetales bacterium 10988]